MTFFVLFGMCVLLCPMFKVSYAHAAMVEDTLSCFHEVYNVTLKNKTTATTCHEVHAHFLKFVWQGAAL